MINLSQSEPFASGGNRFCYRHPERSELCVKVMRPGRTAELLGRSSLVQNLARGIIF
ncbi:YrbL family protein [Microbulbifer sp. ANSA005]|uniref:YrbL family protein n=1 Tax=Microbulbifer sp. ANSA005 TaxID=3243362 RepID=UPI004040FB9D